MAFNQQQNSLAAMAQQLAATEKPTKKKIDNLENLANQVAQDHEMLPRPDAVTQPRSLLGRIAQTGVAVPVAATQELRRATQDLPGSKFGLIGLLSRALKAAPKAIQQAPQVSPLAGQVGTALGKATELGGQAIVGAPLIELAGASALPTVLKPPLGGALVGGATSLSHPLLGALGGAAGGAALEAITPAINLVKNAPNLFVEGLGKKITNVIEDAKNTGKELYAKAFKGGEGVIPTVSQKTGALLQKLKGLFAEPQRIKGTKIESAVDNALNVYQRNVPKKGVEALHSLRSDFSKLYTEGADKALKSGLNSSEKLKQQSLLDTIDSLSNDTAENLKKISPKNLEDYKVAQQHWRDKVVPTRNLLSIRKLTGAEKEPTASLFRDLARRAESSRKVRDMIGMSRTTAQIGNIINNRLAAFPRGLLSDIGLIGSGAILGNNIL